MKRITITILLTLALALPTAELAEMLSAKLLEKNGTWLCSTDTECAKLEAKLR
jgi:hypothetical protein